MTQTRLLILFAHLVFVRLAFAVAQVPGNEPQKTETNRAEDIHHEQQPLISSGQSILDQINSLEYSSSERTVTPTVELSKTKPEEEVAGVNTDPPLVAKKRPLSLKSNRTGRTSRKQAAASLQPSIPQMLFSLLGQLEKVDVKRMLADSIAQVRVADKGVSALPLVPLNGTLNATKPENHSNHQKNVNKSGHKGRERFNTSALAAESGNLLSITKQLVKLARSQVGGDYSYPSSLWLPSGMMMPSMLSAASHMLHDTNDFTAASTKADWFWVVVPAVIVIGAGVIIIPLIAAWLVSSMMNQNTFTVSAGRRRRRRDVNSSDPLADEVIHGDLFRMLDIHKLFDDAPQLLVDKLSRLHRALDSIGSDLADSSLRSAKNRFDNIRNKKN